MSSAPAPTNVPGWQNVFFFVALLATALALGAAMAHVLELPNKISLPASEYFITQKSYRGWNQLGWLLLVQLLSLLGAAITSRARTDVMWLVILALVGLLGAQVVFWLFTFPTNVATRNWTVIPTDWELLRAEWEYSHAAGAAFQLLAMIALILAALRRAHPGRRRSP
jgi:hypothetical protein